MLKVEGVVAAYGAIEVLHGVSVDVAAGEAVAILGPNGAGKTTLLRTIAGFLKPKSGSVTFDGRDITGIAPEQLAVAPECMDARQQRGLAVEGDFQERVGLAALGELELRALPHALIRVAEQLHQRLLGGLGESGGEQALRFHNALVWIMAIISVFVLLLLLWVIVRYNKRANPVPSKTSHNTAIEVIWTLAPLS